MSGTSGAGSLAVGSAEIGNYPPATAAALYAKLTQGAWKEPVRVASNGGAVANLASVTVADFDGTSQGVTLEEGNRVLVKNTASPDGVISAAAKYNGWYVVGPVASGHAALTRDLDADEDPKVNSGDGSFVCEGALAGKVYLLTTPNPLVLGTTALTFSAFATASGGVLPNPTGAGKLPYDTGAAWSETAAGTAHQLLHGAAGAPTWGAVDLATEVSGQLPVANGGTGAASLTTHGVLIGKGTAAVAATAVGATGTVLRGQSGADPVFGAVDLTTDVTGLLPGANISPAANSFVQVVQDAGTMVAGSLVVGSGITVRAGSVFLAIRNNPDPVAAHWGKLSTGSPVVGVPGVGSVTITSSNVGDLSSVTLVIFG